jgi:hypothetical protein
VDIAQRHGEDQPPGPGRQPSDDASPSFGRPSANDVIAVVDRLQQRLEVRLCPRFLGGRDQDKGEMRAFQAVLEGALDAGRPDRDDAALDGPTRREKRLGKRRDDRRRAVVWQVREQDDADAGVGQRVALKVVEEGVVDFLARGHSCSRIRSPGSSSDRGMTG